MKDETLKEIIIRINQEDKMKAFKEVSKEVERFLKKYGNPYTTIIARQDHIELLEGSMSLPFEIED